MQNKQKLTYGIKGKLISATAMLLVALIMVVSSSYAWFTLSTAPEVTGINTAVGANGALEMALRSLEDVKDGQVSGDSNLYWGNLVDLNKNSHGIDYGVDLITLLPSVLNTTDGSTISGQPLQIPAYGADGRVSSLSASTLTGIYDTTNANFYPSKDLGFRAVGTASGMTDRQLAYRTAKSNASTATAQATNVASSSLTNNGGTLANIAVKRGMGGTTATYTQDDVAAMLVIVNDLLGYDTVSGTETVHVTGALEYIEKAYAEYIKMFIAGQANNMSDDDWKAVNTAIADAKLSDLVTETGTLKVGGVSDVLTTEFTTAITKLYETIAEVKNAQSELNALKTAGSNAIQWSEFQAPLYRLADIDAMTLNGYAASTAKENMSNIVNSVASQGVNVVMASGGGVYADIADHCGDYNAFVTIEELSAGGITLTNVNAKMSTETSAEYLTTLGNGMSTISPAPTNSGDQKMPFTEYYGFIVDLAFRTNAKESNLLLQTEAIDRIYDDNTNDATMGHGSTMTFKSTSANFADTQVAALMKHIRLVFFTPSGDGESGGTILAYAKLNMENATIDSNGVTAGIYLYTSSTGTTYKTDANGNYVDASNTVLYYKVGTSYYAAADCTVGADNAVTVNVGASAVAVENMTGLVEVAGTTDTFLEGSDAVITSLTQNTQHNVSVLVYLDGNTITNADVAFDAASSMEGTMNLQFASSANLVPMEYADLHQSGNANNGADAGNQG